MARYFWPGTSVSVELTEVEFLSNLVRRFEHLLLSGCDSLHTGQVQGFPDVGGKWTSRPTRRTIKQLREFIPQVNDQKLRTLLDELCNIADTIINLDAQCVRHIAKKYGMTLANRMRLFKQIQSETTNGASWLRDPEYRLLRRKSAATFEHMWHVEARVARRIKEVVEALGADYVDITAEYTPIGKPSDMSVEALEKNVARYGGKLTDEERRYMTAYYEELLSDIQPEIEE